MPDNKTRPFSQEDLHWFWRLTTQRWFFSGFYLALVLFLTIIWKIEGAKRDFFGVFLELLYFMPSGLLFILGRDGVIVSPSAQAAIVFPLLFHPAAIISVTIISHFKNKKNKILKWLILTLLFLLISAFAGCVTAGLNDKSIILGTY